MQQTLIILSSISVLISYGIYEWSIITGRTKPHRTTRFVLLLITALGTASLFASHDRVAIWLIGLSGLNCFIVFLLSLKYGMGGWAKTDILCLVIALAGIVVWKITDRPALGLYAAILADFAGMVPALLKTYRLPETEYWLSYIFDVAAAILTLFAIRNWGLTDFSYPLYLVVINALMLALTFRPKSIPKPVRT